MTDRPPCAIAVRNVAFCSENVFKTMTTVDKQKQKASPLGGDKKRAAFLPAVPAAPVTVFLAPASGR